MAINYSKYGTWIPPQPVNVTISVDRDYIEISVPDLPEDGKRYGLVYEKNIAISKDGGETYETIDDNRYYFDRTSDGYPEKTDLISNYRIKTWYTNECNSISGTALESLLNAKSLLNYGTWIPPKAVSLKAIALRDYIDLGMADITTDKYYGAPYSEHFSLSKDGGETWEDDISVPYYFSREKDGYPEIDTESGGFAPLSEYRIKGWYKNEITGEIGSVSEVIKVDTSKYGTWIVQAPSIITRISDRTITLILSQPTTSANLTLYGNTQYKVSVKKYEHCKKYLYSKYDSETETTKYYTDKYGTIEYTETIEAPLVVISTGKYITQGDVIITEICELQKIVYSSNGETFYIDSEKTIEYTLGTYESVISLGSDSKYLVTESTSTWYKPAITEDPYSSEENYKSETQDLDYVISDNTYVQTMPLSGQSINCMYDTLYGFRVQAFNESTESGYTVISAVATCTSIRDLVKANADYKQLYVEQLSAISANLGVITQGAFGDKDKNHIAMSTFVDDNNVQWYEGETKLGGNDQYFKITIKKNADGTPIYDKDGNLQYEVSIKAGDINFTSEGIDLGTGTVFKDASNSKRRLRVSSNGMFIEETDVDDPEESDWYTTATMSIDADKNLVVTNDTDLVPEKGIKLNEIDTGAKVYHFKSDVTDEDGIDSLGLNLDKSNITTKQYFLETNYTFGSYLGVISKAVSDGEYVAISKANHIEIGNREISTDGTITQTLAALATTDWGLSESQLKSVFKKV